MEKLINIFRKGRRYSKTLIGRDVVHRVQVKCPKERHGTKYGGWVICPTKITKDSIVCSFGVGEDISFDLSLINQYRCKVYAFDPTPRSIQWVKSQTLPPEFLLFEFGIADYDGIAKFNPPENPNHISHTILERSSTAHNAIEVKVHKLTKILEMLGYDKVDILKMDIEGGEYAVIDDLFKSNIDVHQLLVEFHHNFKNVSIAQTKNTVKLLNDNGFRIFHISPFYEYSFIRI